jgi:putative MFS transporter
VTPAAGVPASGVAALNARIDRLPAWGLSPIAFGVVGLCYFFAFYDITAISSTLPVVARDLHIPETALGAPITSNLVGYVIGAYGFGTLADYAGRRVALAWTVAVLFTGAILTSLSWSLPALVAFRFLTGVGIGAQIALSVTLMGELSSAARRGRHIAYTVLLGGVGLTAPNFIAIPLDAVPGVGWRVVLALGGLIIVIAPFLADRWLPESPRWLVLHGRPAQADRIVERMEARAAAVTGRALPAQPDVPAEAAHAAFPTLELLRTYWRRLLLVLAFWFVYYVRTYGFLSFEPTLLLKMGLPLPRGLAVTGLGLTGSVVGSVIGILVIERWERKYTVTGALVLVMVGLALVATSQGSAQVAVGGWLESMAGFVALPAAYAYTAEIFPTRARASAMSIGDGVGHLGGAVQPFVILPVLAAFGPRPAFWLLVAAAAASLLLMLGGITTRGRPLTRLAQ